MSNSYLVPSVDRALNILELLTHSQRGLTASDLSRKLALPKSSVHLLLKTLVAMGYLSGNPINGKYHFGVKLVRLSHAALANLDLREQARPFLQDLMLSTGLAVHMAVLECDEALIIEKVEVPGMLRLSGRVGGRMDTNSTGAGKALLAFGDSNADPLLNRYAFARHNKNTIASPDRLARELKKVRELGYALDDEENEIGFRCIGVPIYDAADKVISAISVAGVIGQIPRERVPKLAVALQSTAHALSTQLGYKPLSAR